MRFWEMVVKVPEVCSFIINQSYINTSARIRAEK